MNIINFRYLWNIVILLLKRAAILLSSGLFPSG